MELNTVGMAGTVGAAPEPYHNIYGQGNVYALWLNVTRDSGAIDRILVLFQEDKIYVDSFLNMSAATLFAPTGEKVVTVIETTEPDYTRPGGLAELITEGSRVEVTGAIQTYKDIRTGRTQLFVWGLYIASIPEDSQQFNTAYIKGEIAKAPIYRETPKQRRITDITVRIPSIFAAGYYSFIHCITWEKLADRAADLQEGDTVYLEGRIKSRDYKKYTPEEVKVLTAWEVSANKLEVEVNQSNGY